MSRLLKGPVELWTGETAEELPSSDTPDRTGFTILQDLRIIDLRRWKQAADKDTDSYIYGYRRLKVRREPDNPTNSVFRISVLALSPDTRVRFPAQELTPKLYSRVVNVSGRGEKLTHWEVGTDFQKVPVGDFADIIYEHESPGLFL